MNRIHIITLGVSDMNRSLRFYRDVLGFEITAKEKEPEIAFFRNRGTTLALYPKEGIARDINDNDPPQGSGFGGITLAYVASSESEVDEIIMKAAGSGGRLEKSPRRVFWGGYSGYFSDPDVYYWEIMYWEQWKFTEDGGLAVD
ncbi:MAG: VOC family protein [Spirochaetales bacterium]|nr:VOC family protein [Spirochaetales bacterium]